ncbi:MAG: hypothetical protein WDM91_07540 [Rhizomicrobium sp.]
MRPSCIVLAALLAAPAALAAPPPGKICIDPRRSYQALYLEGHDIVARQTIGRDHRQLRLSTTCIGLRSADMIRLSSDFNCVGMGDDVIAGTIDGHRQTCRISHAEPYTPPAAP